MKTDRLARTVLLLGVTSFFTDIGSEMIFPLLPVFIADTLGGGGAFLGIFEGAGETVASLLKLLAGKGADRLPRRKPLVVTGYALASFARPFVALATAPWHALVVRLIDRTGKGIRSSPRDALIADSAGTAVGRAFGFHRAMDHAGAVVGPLVATGLLSAGLPVRHVFLVAAVPGVLALATVALVREKPRATPESKKNETGAPLSKTFKAYLGVLLVFSLGNSTDAFLLLRARDLGLSLAAIPVLWALLHVSKMLWSYVGGVWSDRVPRVRLVLGGWIVYSVTYLALAHAFRPWHVWALFVVYGAFHGLSEPAEKALVRDLAPAAERGRWFGYYNFVLGAASLPAGILTGFLWSKAGSAVALMAGAAISILASALLAAWSMTRRADESRQDQPIL